MCSTPRFSAACVITVVMITDREGDIKLVSHVRMLCMCCCHGRSGVDYHRCLILSGRPYIIIAFFGPDIVSA